tara:strand:- start:1235 stop:1918 length:684 start_codon:yes stop_codon:yes gene_type:complete
MIMNSKQDVSVIIRARNEERWIGHCIQSILEWLTSPEIIVVDNNSNDKTLEIVKRFKHDPELNEHRNFAPIKIVKIDEYSPGASINLGVKYATNGFILVISSHCVLKQFDLEKHKKSLLKFDAIFGKQTPVWDGKKIAKRYIWSHFGDDIVENMYSDMERRYFFHNALSFFKKDILEKEPFDEHLVGKEDRYWAEKIISKDHNFLYDPSMEVDHHYTDNGNTWKGIG